MKKNFLFLALFILVSFLGCQKQEDEIITPQSDESKLYKSGEVIPQQFIVIFKEEFKGIKSKGASYQANLDKVSKRGTELLLKSNIQPRKFIHTYASAIEGFAINLTESEVNELRKQEGIEIYPDRIFTLENPEPVNFKTVAEATIPYGVARVGYGVYSGTNKAWIIDTGIDLNHPDLNVNTTLGKTFVKRTKSPEDDNGHGTHCAGIIAAKDNSIGVIGVAANAFVVPVKVLDRRGSGAYSTIIAGVDYVAATATDGDVVNLSLGGGVYDPLDQAVKNLGLGGLYVAIAAGNSSSNANNYSPARANGVNLYTVSACDASDVWAYFSNYGNPPIDFCAPGVNIYSTYKGDSYATMSGTSMAAPHVCGLLLLNNGNVNSDGFVTGDPDGNPDPIAHK